MQLTVFGATGRTGRPLVDQALARGHSVVAFARDAADVPVSHENLAVVEGDAYTGSGVREAVAGSDAVISVLGQSKSGPDDLLSVAGDHILDAIQAAGIDRFVTLVGAGVRTEDDSPSVAGRVMGAALKLVSGEVLADAERHVEHVRATDIDWTVVRVPRLTEDPGTGSYEAGDVSLGFAGLSRADVATFILDCIEDDLYVRDLPKVGPA